MTYKILLVGQSGAGKSTLVNALFGKPHAKVNDYEPCTTEIQEYNHVSRYGKIIVYDSPGFSSGTDSELIADLKKLIKENEFYKIIYCTPLNMTRLRQSEKKTLTFLTKLLSKRLFLRVWILFTFGDIVNQQFFLYENRLKHINNHVALIFGINNPFKNRVAIFDSLGFNWWNKNCKNTQSISCFFTSKRSFRKIPINIKASKRMKKKAAQNIA